MQYKTIHAKDCNEVPKTGYYHVIYPDNSQFWYKHGELHRLDSPAVIYPNGSQYWFTNDKLSRINGPAAIHPDGTQYWFINNKSYSEKEYWKKIYDMGEISEKEYYSKLV